MTPTQSITGIVLNSGAPGTYDTDGTDFDLLRDAVVAADLAGALDDPAAGLTVFAPNDDAFIALAQTLGYSGGDEAGALAFTIDALTLLGRGDPLPLLTDILTYHVVDGVFDLAAVAGLGDGANITTLQGSDVTLNLGSMPPSLMDLDDGIADPNLIAFDIHATNGIIHVLDGVLLPLPVSDILSQPGTDLFVGTDVDDNVNGRGGDDFLGGGAGEDTLNGGSGDDVVQGGEDSDTLSGRKGDDLLQGGQDDDKLTGNAGADTLEGDGGADTLNGGGGTDELNGGGGDDRVSGGGGGDTAAGRKGDDLIKGGAGDDKLTGNGGDDTLDGGAGNDTLNGGGGEDVFVFSQGYGRDRIGGFEDGVDKIDVSGLGITSFDQIEGLITSHGPRTEISFGDGDVLVLAGVESSALDASDFIFA